MLDTMISAADNALRTLSGASSAARALPARHATMPMRPRWMPISAADPAP